MKKSVSKNDCTITMHAGIKDDKLKFIIAITNEGDETFHGKSPMSSWFKFKLKDNININRVNSKGQLAMVTPYKIVAGKTIFQTITPYTLKEAEKEAEEWNSSMKDYSITAITDIYEYKNKSEKNNNIKLIPNVCLDRDKNCTFYAECIIKIRSLSTKINMKFTLSELSELPNVNSLYNTQ